jgi:hypothetical protein
VSRNDTEYSYRISITWKDIPAKSDAEYICYASRNEDGITDARVEFVHVYGKYSILRTYSRRNFPCTDARVEFVHVYGKYSILTLCGPVASLLAFGF